MIPLLRRRVFYGWWIVGAAIGIQGLVSALLFHAFGTYVVLLERDFGWSKPGSTEPATRFGCRDTQTGAPLKLG